MKLRVVHKTEYVHEDMVSLSHGVAHLRPRNTPRQRCLASELSIVPLPTLQHERVDYFGNRLTWFSVEEPYNRLTVNVKSLVEVSPTAPPAPCGSSWEEVVQLLREGTRRDVLEARAYALESPTVPTAPELADYARLSFPPGRELTEGLAELVARIHDEFEFKPGTTTVGTPVLEVLASRRGVCQDFAHLSLGCLRSLGLAARYVSGYLLTLPPPGKPRLQGVDASHAWIAVFVPGQGWVDYDPTNGLLPSDQHVTVGWARDYDDICPLKGVILGGQRHVLKVSVDVTPEGSVLESKTG